MRRHVEYDLICAIKTMSRFNPCRGIHFVNRREHAMRARAWLLPIVMMVLFAFRCGTMPVPTPTMPVPSPEYWPTDGWRTSTPEEQGVSSETLVRAVKFVQEEDFHVHSMTVIRNGYIIADAYFYPYAPGFLHDLASCTKSFTATLIGIALKDGYIKGLDQPLLGFFPQRTVANVDERKEAITLEDLLTMSSGLECIAEPIETTLFQMMGSPDWVQFMLDQPMRYEPGAHFVYCSGGSHLLSAIIRETTGTDALGFAEQRLFGPLGITEVAWPYDPQGINNHGWGDLHLSPHDMAKLGYLYLNNGVWDGRQIVSPEWVSAATRRHVSFWWKFHFNGYGYQWWTDTSGYYGAWGRGGQKIVVVPEENMVIVLTGGDGSSEAENKRGELIESFLIPAAESQGALPANPAAFASLKSIIAGAVQAPEGDRTPTPPLPPTAAEISGKTYVLENNQFGLVTCSLTFDREDEALFRLTLNPAITGMEEIAVPIGLDNVLRISPGGRFGLPVAMKGSWETDTTFVIHFDEIGNINNWRISMTFEDATVSVLMEEMTGLGSARFDGQARE
jgi:CubicO group peptidase (beta-lactamase class C family)